MTKRRTCRECGQPFQPISNGRYGEKDDPRRCFCSTQCRKVFNNRRAMRGADIYDLLRAIRRERGTAHTLKLWSALCRLEEAMQEEDDRERPGRRSYVPPREALLRLADAGKISRRLTPAQIDADAERRSAVNAAKDRASMKARQEAAA